MLLLDAYEQLGNEEYRKASILGMDFYIISQVAEPQAGWSEQYSHDMKPAQACSYEPAGIHSRQTMFNIRDLQNYYKITGDLRYLEPIPAAIR